MYISETNEFPLCTLKQKEEQEAEAPEGGE